MQASFGEFPRTGGDDGKFSMKLGFTVDLKRTDGERDGFGMFASLGSRLSLAIRRFVPRSHALHRNVSPVSCSTSSYYVCTLTVGTRAPTVIVLVVDETAPRDQADNLRAALQDAASSMPAVRYRTMYPCHGET